MKRVLWCLPVLALLVYSRSVAATASIEKGLTRGVEILYEQDRLEKAAQPGESIVFSHLDFLPCCGQREMDGVIILQAPSPDEGSLKIGGETVKSGSFIPSEMIEKLRFEPNNAQVTSAVFAFSFEEGGAARYCVLHFDGETSPVPTAKDVSINTYRNVACFVSLDGQNVGGTIKITQSPRHGVIRVDQETGTICYAPGRNQTGTDTFRYRITNRAGVSSSTGTVKIRIKKSPQNIFFTDCVDMKWHKSAIDLCEEGLLGFGTNKDGLPVFQPDLPLSEKERDALIKYAARIRPDGVLAVSGGAAFQTRGEALELIDSLKANGI